MQKEKLLENLKNMDEVCNLFNMPPIEVYLLGGSACLLGGYTTRATMDYDFIDLNYLAGYGKVFALLRDYDMLEYSNTAISPSYKDRAKKIDGFKYISVYILSKEDIAVSKIIRLETKDIEDLDEIMKQCDRKLVNEIIDEVLEREDFFESKKEAFRNKLKIFKERYNV